MGFNKKRRRRRNACTKENNNNAGSSIIRRKRRVAQQLDSKKSPPGRSRHTKSGGIFFGGYYRKSKTREVPSSEAVSTRVHSGESAKSNMALVWPRRSRTHWDVRASQSRTTPSVDVLRVRAKNRRKSTTWSARVIGRKNVNSIKSTFLMCARRMSRRMLTGCRHEKSWNLRYASE